MRPRTLEEINKKKVKPIWDPSYVLEYYSPSTSPSGRSSLPKRKCVTDHPIEFIDVNILGTWTLENITKAAKLLRKPPLPVNFGEEHEMRKVYSLIYDVYRYKVVLSQALSDVSFFAHYPELKPHETRIWLMLFELYTRHFLQRKSEQIEVQNKLYAEADIDYIASCLWEHRIRLAASISRLRIKNGALHLSQLLPIHLQNEKVAIAAANPIVTGWINPFKLKKKEMAEELLQDMGLTEVPQCNYSNEKPLKLNQYKWDTVCPLFMSCLPEDRSEFAKSKFVKCSYLILQDRTFSIAPAILSRLLDHFQLDGDVLQTHVSSPRSTCYLASLFFSINRLNEFLAFGAGDAADEYKEYINMLGITNVRLFTEPFTSIPLESSRLDSVVGVFATPPNSFSAISDPIDLICSRGGDLGMLEVLTESEISDDGKRRVSQILQAQRDTLRMAMSRPHVQFILYQTHSIVGSENQDMVENSVDEVNRNAFNKHLDAFKEKKRIEALQLAEAANIPSAALGTTSPRKRGGTTNSSANKIDETTGKPLDQNQTNSTDSLSIMLDEFGNEDYSNCIKVPKTDEFEVANIPDVCLNQDNCLDFGSIGCFVSLIKRKQISKLDAKFLIKMAEGRGLFGKADRSKSAKQKGHKKTEKKVSKVKKDSDVRKSTTKSDIETLINRLNAPTNTSCIRSNLKKVSTVSSQPISFNFMERKCTRHIKHNSPNYPVRHHGYSRTRARKWWYQTTKYIRELQAMFRRDTNKPCDNILQLAKYIQLHPLYLPRAEVEIDIFRPSKFTKVRIIERSPYPVTVKQLELGTYSKLRRKALFTDDCTKRTIPADHKILGLPLSSSK